MKTNTVYPTLLFLLCSFWNNNLLAQDTPTDTIKQKSLQLITITSYRLGFQEVQQLATLNNMLITAGKKNEVIAIQDLPANLAEKSGRQIFAKIPGAFIYDMDGSGNQVNIATRGLDPHRSWEYNIRQNGIMTNSDIYGYPASHYSPPMEAIQKIEIIRGLGALQYGAQFGGMINYVVKKPDTSQQLGYESINSVGSYGLLSTFHAISGQIGKVKYYAYYQRRVSDGYRDNARSDAQAQYISLVYTPSQSFTIRAELGRSQYIYQIPGPLTDSMFYLNPRQATRNRNYFNPDIYVPSITIDWNISPTTQLSWSTSALLGARNSIQFIDFANVMDKIDASTLQYKPRQVDTDHFNSYTSEIKLQKNYQIADVKSVLTTGIRAINNDLHRQQLGKGTTGTDFDLSITGNFGRDLHFKTQNLAFFAENLFQFSPKWFLSVGARLEKGNSKTSGIINYLPTERVPHQVNHQFSLLGASFEYRFKPNHKIYGGCSQSYRPVVFSDIIPPTTLDRTDPNLKNAYGYNAEIGIRGTLNDKLTYDLTCFQILYKNRIGSLILIDDNGQNYIWKTNIGDSKTNGVELYAEYSLLKMRNIKLAYFTASSFFDAIYLNGKIRDGNINKDLTGNRLETVPTWISRNGLQMAYQSWSAILQYNFVDKSFSDALNTQMPSANGARGLVPSYSIWDLNMSYRFKYNYLLRLGINNFMNKQYFTKRPTGYPGQGVWSSDGRSIVASFSIKL